jgi:beta-N-acetylhexosaminidase
MGYGGITFTDALEMQGVAKYYPAGEASVQSLIAGNDMLCLPGDVPGSIEKVLAAIKSGKLSQASIDERVKKVLLAKYHLGLDHIKPIETAGITKDINEQTTRLKKLLAENALTLLHHSDPSAFAGPSKKRIAYLGVGGNYLKPNTFATRLKNDYNADLYFWDYKRDMGTVPMMIYTLQNKYDQVIIGMHNYSRRPANNFGLSYASSQIINQFQDAMPSTTFVFGNPYAIKNISKAKNLVAAYEDDEITQQAAIDMLEGKLVAKGELPVTVDDNLHFGTGIKYNYYFPESTPASVGMNEKKLKEIDGIVADAIEKGATPGGVVLVAKNGKVIYHKAYGSMEYNKREPVTKETVYDLASVTKVSATTVSVMKLYEEGKLDLNKTLGDYLPWVRGSDKAGLKLTDILLHQAGLVAYIPFYRYTIDSATGKPNPMFYHSEKDETFSIRVAEDLYLRNDYINTIQQTILKSKLGPADKYIYSDNDFIFLGKIVEAISGLTLDEYAKKNFYDPLQMKTTRFKPREHMPINEIAPTENEKAFRMQLLRGDVHDPGAAMFGGVAGHAGLFSNAYDLAQLYQMLLNGGEMNGVRFFKKETVDKFTAYSSNISRRGLGFDKPEKDNTTRKEPYPTLSASGATFGHTGFTGTCVWADPQSGLLYIFLSNRVNPEGGDNGKLLRMNVRSNVHETIYQAINK